MSDDVLLEEAGPDTSPEDLAEEEEDSSIDVIEAGNLRFETKKFVLQALLEKASSVLPTKDIMPVLKNFQLEAEGGRVRVAATDLELSVVASTEMVKIPRQGTAVFPGKRMLELVKEAEDGEIIVDVKDGTAHIQVGRATWDLKLNDGTEYPALPDIDQIEFHSVSRSKFLEALNSVRYAAATDTVRPSLMMVDITEGRMRAADGVRFQQVDISGWPESLDIQIPINAVDDLVKLLRTTELNAVEIGDSESHIVFRVGADVFIANKLMAVFPDVDEVLLKPALANDEELRVDRNDFVAAIKRVRVTADEETSAVVLSLENDSLTVKSHDKFGNTASETVDVSWSSGEKEVAFNHVHLLDMLNMADVKTCHFYLGKDLKTRKAPIMLKDEETGMIGILNQIRIDFLS